MKVAALLVMISAWGCVFLWRGTAARLAQLIVFGLLGTVFTLAGGFTYWWDSHMRPDQSSSFLFVCGLLTLLSQAGTLLAAVFNDLSEIDAPRRTMPRPKRPQDRRKDG
jgi:Na+/melibiose symporter-like transporter